MRSKIYTDLCVQIKYCNAVRNDNSLIEGKGSVSSPVSDLCSHKLLAWFKAPGMDSLTQHKSNFTAVDYFHDESVNIALF